MAKTRASLLSTNATGSLANTLTWQTWRGRNYARKKPIPAQPRTAAQQHPRMMFQTLVTAWKQLSSAQRATWQTHPTAPATSPYHAYVRTGLQRWALHRGPSALWPTSDEFWDCDYYEYGGSTDHMLLSLYGENSDPYPTFLQLCYLKDWPAGFPDPPYIVAAKFTPLTANVQAQWLAPQSGTYKFQWQSCDLEGRWGNLSEIIELSAQP